MRPGFVSVQNVFYLSDTSDYNFDAKAVFIQKLSCPFDHKNSVKTAVNDPAIKQAYKTRAGFCRGKRLKPGNAASAIDIYSFFRKLRNNGKPVSTICSEN